MNVYSLVGKSGTGKSYLANELCDEFNIDSIIDDGLFIVKGSIVAGISAKRQLTRIRAIKTALYNDEEHRSLVKNAIAETKPSALLLIGTSDKMINIISKRLEVGEPKVRFDIEELTTSDERETAKKYRFEMGQHVIPAPTFQIKKDFSGYFLHPIKTIRDITQDFRGGLPRSGSGRANASSKDSKKETFAERTIVRPTYSYYGQFKISDKAISDIINLTAEEEDSIDSVSYSFIKNLEGGAAVALGVIVKEGVPILEAARKIQALILAKLEDITSINMLSVDVEIQGLMWTARR